MDAEEIRNVINRIGFIRASKSWPKDSSDALEAAERILEKQIPVRPKIINKWGNKYCICPDCGGSVSFDSLPFNNPNYCEHCGKKLIWR